MKKKIKYFILLLLTASVMAGGYPIQFGTSKQGYSVYWIYNPNDYYIYCEIFGDRSYYNEFEVPPNRSSRSYYTPRESITARCE